MKLVDLFFFFIWTLRHLLTSWQVFWRPLGAQFFQKEILFLRRKEGHVNQVFFSGKKPHHILDTLNKKKLLKEEHFLQSIFGSTGGFNFETTIQVASALRNTNNRFWWKKIIKLELLIPLFDGQMCLSYKITLLLFPIFYLFFKSTRWHCQNYVSAIFWHVYYYLYY